MKIAVIQTTFNTTTIGWTQGATELGHQLIHFIQKHSKNDPVGGVVGHFGIIEENVHILASKTLPRGLLRLIPINKIGRRLAWVSPFQVRRSLRQRQIDMVLIKRDGSLRSLVFSLTAFAIGLPRYSWFEVAPEFVTKRSQVLSYFGIFPRRYFCTNAGSRPGHKTVISYGAPRWPNRVKAKASSQPGVLVVESFKNIERKRPWCALQAYAKFQERSPCHWSFAGVGTDKSPGLITLQSAIDSLDLKSYTNIILSAPYRDMWRLYDRCDVLVLTSKGEPFGMCVLEAMARGLAVIIPDDAGVAGNITHGVDGYLYPVGDFDSLAVYLRELLDNPMLLSDIRAAARTAIHEKFSHIVVAERLINWFDRI